MDFFRDLVGVYRGSAANIARHIASSESTNRRFVMLGLSLVVWKSCLESEKRSQASSARRPLRYDRLSVDPDVVDVVLHIRWQSVTADLEGVLR
jgi:hypothetical protein